MCKGIVKNPHVINYTIKQNLSTFTIPHPSFYATIPNKSGLLQPARSKRTKRFTPFLGLLSRAVVQQVALSTEQEAAREILKILTASLNGTETNMCQAHLVVPHVCCKERRESKEEKREKEREKKRERESTDGLGFSNEFSGIPRSR